jgi:hypothetical protein
MQPREFHQNEFSVDLSLPCQFPENLIFSPNLSPFRHA